MFKTLVIDGTTGLNIAGYTDLDQVEMSSSQFIDKEGKWYAYLKRPQNQISFDLLSTQGVGIVDNIVGTTINFNTEVSNVDAGDVVYRELNGLTELIGTVSDASANSITVVSYISSDNIKSLKFTELLGFRHIATIKDAIDNGVDLVIKEMRRKDCRWIDKEVRNG